MVDRSNSHGNSSEFKRSAEAGLYDGDFDAVLRLAIRTAYARSAVHPANAVKDAVRDVKKKIGHKAAQTFSRVAIAKVKRVGADGRTAIRKAILGERAELHPEASEPRSNGGPESDEAASNEKAQVAESRVQASAEESLDDNAGPRTRFVALLIASGQLWSLSKQAISARRAESAPKQVAYAVGGAVALRLAMRSAFAGPLATIVTAATFASLIEYFALHRGRIAKAVEAAQRDIDEASRRYSEIQGGHVAGRLSDQERELMVDGLVARLVAGVVGGI